MKTFLGTLACEACSRAIGNMASALATHSLWRTAISLGSRVTCIESQSRAHRRKAGIPHSPYRSWKGIASIQPRCLGGRKGYKHRSQVMTNAAPSWHLPGLFAQTNFPGLQRSITSCPFLAFLREDNKMYLKWQKVT